jgi:hypothetical protein
MAGGSPRHNALSAAIVRDVGAVVRGSKCRVLSSDQRIVLSPGERYVYADVSLVCGQLELAAGTSDVLTNPRTIFEVLSRSTEAYDRGDKWAAYGRIASLREYVLVSQLQPRIEKFSRILALRRGRGRRAIAARRRLCDRCRCALRGRARAAQRVSRQPSADRNEGRGAQHQSLMGRWSSSVEVSNRRIVPVSLRSARLLTCVRLPTRRMPASIGPSVTPEATKKQGPRTRSA